MPKDFKELSVWSTSLSFVKLVYSVTSTFPKEELYGITNQLRRAAVSIGSNIAEGCGRRTLKDYMSFLYTALGSCKECENLLIVSRELGFIQSESYASVSNEVEKIGCMLIKLISYVNRQINTE